MMQSSNTPYYVVGGVVVAGTTLAVFGILGVFENGGNTNDESIQSQEYAYRSGASVLPLPPTLSPQTTSPSDSSRPSNGPSLSPSLRPTRLPSSLPSFSPSTSPPTVIPSISPTTSLMPSYHPSVSPSFRPSHKPSSSPSTLLQSISSNGSYFYLRLHWQRGFFWQELSEEAWFCMACASCNDNIFEHKDCDIETHCNEGMSLAMVKCDPSKKKKKRYDDMTKFTLLANDNGLAGHQIQVYDTDLCMQRKGRHISLQKCNASLEEQRFLGVETGGQAMELMPYPGVFRRNGVEVERCLTQHHHPRPGERVYVMDCRKARNSHTNMWSAM